MNFKFKHKCRLDCFHSTRILPDSELLACGKQEGKGQGAWARESPKGVRGGAKGALPLAFLLARAPELAPSPSPWNTCHAGWLIYGTHVIDVCTRIWEHNLYGHNYMLKQNYQVQSGFHKTVDGNVHLFGYFGIALVSAVIDKHEWKKIQAKSGFMNKLTI